MPQMRVVVAQTGDTGAKPGLESRNFFPSDPFTNSARCPHKLLHKLLHRRKKNGISVFSSLMGKSGCPQNPLKNKSLRF